MNRKIENKYENITKDFNTRVNNGNLKNLSLSDAKTIFYVIRELKMRHAVKTCIKNVADYFRKFGFIVTMEFDGVNFVIVD